MRSVLMTLVAALALLAFTGTQVHAAGKGGHTASKRHTTKAKKGGKHSEKKKAEHKKEGHKKEDRKKEDRKKEDRKKEDRKEHEKRARR